MTKYINKISKQILKQNMQMLPLHRVGRRRTINATAIREQFENYFISKPGAMPRQSNIVNRVQ